MDGLRVAVVVGAVIAAVGSATSGSQQPPPQQYPPQQQYPQQQYPQQYPQQQYPQQQPSYPPQYPSPAQQAATNLRCGQLLTDCYRCTSGADCAARCVQASGTPRAQWLHLAIAACAKAQNCSVGSCIEQGCAPQMAACRADASGPGDPMLPVPFEGEWFYGGVSIVGFYSATTGWSPAASKGGSFKFMSNGTYEHALLLETQSYGCAYGAAEWTTGTFTMQGNQLSLAETQHKVRSAGACGAQTSSASNAPLEKHVYVMQFLPDPFSGEPQMTLYENGTAISNPYSHR